MSNHRLIDFISASKLVPRPVAEAIAGHFEEMRVVKHAFLVEAGHVANSYVFLESGYMRTFVLAADGREVTTNFYVPGQMVFEVSAFFNRTRSKESIQALTDCTGWSITLDQLNHLFHSMPEFREFGRAMLVRGFSELKTRMLSTITETAEERYLDLVSRQPELLQQASLKQIASFLGITDTSLSRIRAALSKK